MGICVKKIKNEWPNNNHFCAVMHGNGVETCNFEKNDSCRFNTSGLKKLDGWIYDIHGIHGMIFHYSEWFFFHSQYTLSLRE